MTDEILRQRHVAVTVFTVVDGIDDRDCLAIAEKAVNEALARAASVTTNGVLTLPTSTYQGVPRYANVVHVQETGAAARGGFLGVAVSDLAYRSLDVEQD